MQMDYLNEESVDPLVAPCRDSKLKEYCCLYSDTLPFCGVIRPETGHFNDPTRILWGGVNCSDLFEIKEELLKGGYFKFRAASWCMFPVLMKGDMLKIIPSKIEDITIGDITVYRSQGRLFAHRAVDKQIIKGKQFIVTRPDQSKGFDSNENQESVSVEDILGKIEEIKRGKKVFPAEKRRATIWEKFLYEKDMLLSKAKDSIRKILKVILIEIQALQLYKVFGRNLVPKMRPHFKFELAVPFSDEISNRLYVHTALEENEPIDLSEPEKNRIFHLVMKFRNAPIGYAAILNRPESCPHKGLWIGGLYIRLRYRGLGLGSILLRKAKEILPQDYLKQKSNNISVLY